MTMPLSILYTQMTMPLSYTNDYALINSVHTTVFHTLHNNTVQSIPQQSSYWHPRELRKKHKIQNGLWKRRQLTAIYWHPKKETQERKNTKFKMVSEREDNSQLILDKLGHHFQSKRQDVGGPEAQCWTLGLQDLAKVGLDEGNGAEGSTDVIGETAVGKVVQGVGGHEQANTSLHGDLWGKTVHQLWKGKPPIWLKKNVGRWHI